MSEVPAWVTRMEKATDSGAVAGEYTGYRCSGFEANSIAREWRNQQAENERLRGENIGLDQERTIREVYVSRLEQLLREAVTAYECGVWGPCFSRVEANKPRVVKWIEAAREAAGGDDE